MYASCTCIIVLQKFLFMLIQTNSRFILPIDSVYVLMPLNFLPFIPINHQI